MLLSPQYLAGLLIVGLLGATILPSVYAQTTFTVTTTSDSGAGSLRQAIEDANANPGADVIAFDIPGDGVRTITIDSPDPLITDPVTIDGLTQPGASCTSWPPTLLIEITGESSSIDLLTFADGADGSVIRGLVLNNYSSGIDIGEGADGVRIECNFVGTNSAGTAPQQSGGFSEGITVTDASNVVIGGPDPGQRNLISGSGDNEIEVDAIFSDVTGIVIQGNFIGTEVTGTTVITEVDEAIDFGASLNGTISGVLIGGVDHDEGVCNRACNVIAGAEEGIQLSQTSGVTIQGNHIGVDVTGTVVLGGVEEGIQINTSSGTLIGGTEPGAGNVIAGFEEEGIVIFGPESAPAVGNAILGNSIYGNGLLGIDLMQVGVGTGPTPNDPGDADEDTNRLQNFPEINDISYDAEANQISLTYRVDSAPTNSTYPIRVEFFRADADLMEGKAFLGSDTYTEADFTGGPDKSIQFMPVALVSKSDYVVATATDDEGNTSEFSVTAQQLPVELVSFEATLDGENTARLTWQTASETGNAGFEIERTIGEGWQALAFVAGAGTTSQPQSYRFVDAAVPFEAEALAYRLKQVDTDGAFAYSPEVEVALAAPEALALEPNFPNPFAGQTTLRYALPQAGPVRLAIYDVLGRQVAVLVDKVQDAGRYTHAFAARGLVSGIYFVRLQAGTQTQTRRMAVMR